MVDDRRDAADALATRPLGPLLWHTCSQTTLSVGVYGVYAVTNAWFVARGVGVGAMAAVDLAAPVLLVLGAVSTTVGAGCASLVSRSLGARDTAAAARATGTASVLFWATAAVVTVVGLLALDPLVTALGAPASQRDDTRVYTTVLLCGAVVSTGFSAVVRAEGAIRFATVLWVVPVLTQIALDPLLIMGFDLGVAGAAWGTVGGQAVSAGLSLWHFFGRRHRPYRISARDLVPHRATAAALVATGTPSLLAGWGAIMLTVLVNHLLSAGAGTTALAAYAVRARISTFVAMPQTGLGQGLQPVVGFNTGRGLVPRATKALHLALRASLGYGAAAGAAVWVCAAPLARVFVDDPHVVAVAVQGLRTLAVGVPVAGVATIVSGYFQAVGRTAPSYAISTGTVLLVKAPLVAGLGVLGGAQGLFVALACGEVVTAGVAAALLLRRPAPPPDKTSDI